VRLFAAVIPPPDVLAELAAALPGPVPALRFVPAEQRHLTVAFYADVPEVALADFSERLRRACARTAPISLRLNGFGTFPTNAARARVLWAGVVGDVAELTRLAERALAAGRRAGIDVEERRYRPHLTVARARRGAADVRSALEGASLDGTPWTAAELVLVRSTLGAEVRHERVATFPLSAAAPEPR
jgi:RNA 2',3'-cyclic 3'-phosphodiesterase